MRIAPMRQFPIQHGGQALWPHHHITHPQIAMDQAGSGRRRQMVFTPFDCERDNRPVPAISLKPALQLGERGLGVHMRQGNIVARGNGVDARQFARQIGNQACRGIGQNCGRVHLGLHPLHDIACAQIILRVQLAHNFRGEHAAGMRRAHQLGFDIMAKGPAFHHRGRRCTPQHIARPAPIEGPAFHIRPAGQANKIGQRQACATGHARQGTGEFIGVEAHRVLQ